MDNRSQITLGFMEETTLQSTTPPAAREDQPVNIGVRIKRLKKTEDAVVAENKVTEYPADAVASDHDRVEDAGNALSKSIPAADTTPEFPAGLPEEKAAVSFDTAEIIVLPADTASNNAQSPVKSGRGRKSIRQISEEADLIRIPDDEVLFQKQYYTMGEVAGMFRVNQSLLRFWEAEFDILQPKKNKKGDRYFRPADIKNLHLIYHLLRQRKYTIEGAKDFLRKGKKADEKFEAIRKLEQIRDFLLEMKASIR